MLKKNLLKGMIILGGLGISAGLAASYVDDAAELIINQELSEKDLVKDFSSKEILEIKEKVKESNRTNESNKSKNSKNPNGQKNSKGNLPKTSYASGIVGYGVSVLASVLGAFAIGKKRKED